MSDGAQRLAALADRYWDARVAADPLWATVIGDRRHDDRLPDLSREAEDTQAATFAALAGQAAAISPAELDPAGRVTRSMLVWEAEDEAARRRARLAEFTLSAQSEGPQAPLLQLPLSLRLRDSDQADALVRRLNATGDYLDQAVMRYRQGAAAGRTPPRVNVDRVVSQLRGYLASPIDSDPYLSLAPPPVWSATQADGWRDAVRRAVAGVLRPALERYRAFLATELAPRARSDERCGACWLPDGEPVYALAVRSGTSLEMTAGDIHRIGLEAVEALAAEYQKVGAAALGTPDVAEVFRRLRQDPALRFDTSEEVLAAARRALDRAQAAVPAVFGRLPAAGCDVHAMADFEVADGTIAYYLEPSFDGARPGTYYVNTSQPHTRPRFEAEALAFHEAVPGHHLQVALAQELEGLPTFRRHALVNAYVEGWALYAEQLADELGLYDSDLDRLGMLSFASWRACRLVVDTGVHALGWSRQQAIAYMHDNSPLARNNIVNEVDRYLANPGQALGYELGKREILRLRERARTALRTAFDLAAFHDLVLGHGAVPLGTLAEIIDARLTDRTR